MKNYIKGAPYGVQGRKDSCGSGGKTGVFVYKDAYNYKSRGRFKSFINSIKNLFKRRDHSKHGTVLYL